MPPSLSARHLRAELSKQTSLLFCSRPEWMEQTTHTKPINAALETLMGRQRISSAPLSENTSSNTTRLTHAEKQRCAEDPKKERTWKLTHYCRNHKLTDVTNSALSQGLCFKHDECRTMLRTYHWTLTTASVFWCRQFNLKYKPYTLFNHLRVTISIPV